MSTFQYILRRLSLGECRGERSSSAAPRPGGCRVYGGWWRFLVLRKAARLVSPKWKVRRGKSKQKGNESSLCHNRKIPSAVVFVSLAIFSVRSIRRRSRTASVTAPVFSSSSPSSSPPSLGPSFSSLLSPPVGVCRRLVEAIAPAASRLDDDGAVEEGVVWTEQRGDNGKGKGIELALAVWWCTAQAAWQP